MKIRSLVNRMTHAEVVNYCLKHPGYNIPTSNIAESLNIKDIEHKTFWVDETIGGRYVLYNKKKQNYFITHPLLKNNVILVKK